MAPRLSEAKRIEAENFETAKTYFLHSLENLNDPRRRQGLRYPISLVVMSALCAVVAGADDAQAMEDFAAAREDFFREFLPMPHGTPSQDVYLSVFAALCPIEFERVFSTWVNWLHCAVPGARCDSVPATPSAEYRHIAVDGKTNRASSTDKGVPLHALNAWLVESGVCIGQQSSDKKEGEIKAIPQLLRNLDLKGSVVTIDAIGCQHAIADQVVKQGGDYVLQVKANQKTLLYDCTTLFAAADKGVSLPENNSQDMPHSESFQKVEKDHGRIETRSVSVCHDKRWLNENSKFTTVQSFIRVERKREVVKTGKASHEVSYYVSSIPKLSAAQASRIVREHWSIENSLHWVLDVAFNEDRATHRAGNCAANFSVVRKWALNLLKMDTSKKCGIKNRRKIAGWDTGYLRLLLAKQRRN